jgi:hypothetical protein
MFLDATECPINRPTYHQEYWYSGKKKCHTLKYEGILNNYSLSFFIEIAVGVRMRDGLIVWCPYTNPIPGRMHDVRLAREVTEVINELEPWEMIVCDRGYQGLERAIVPVRSASTPEDHLYNSWLHNIRSVVERCIGRIKTFRCLTTRWRHDLKYHPCAFQVCAQLTNLSILAHPLFHRDHSLIDK